jgi:methylglutaconyl-CoA hydratase
MSEAALLVDQEGPILWLTLNRPDQRNALDAPLIAGLRAELDRASVDGGVRVVALRGAGKDFCAGADLASLRAIADASVMENLADADALAELYLAIRRCRKPVVAVVQGRALAGGCGLATACDLVVAADDAEFGYPEVQLGFVPAMVMAILRRSVSEKLAFELVTLGRRVGAGEALAAGMINRVHSAGELEPSARGFIEELAGRSASAVQLCKRLLHHQDGMGYEAAIRAGADVNAIARMTEDMRAGIAGFLQKGR